MALSVIEKMGGLDILINAAGMSNKIILILNIFQNCFLSYFIDRFNI